MFKNKIVVNLLLILKILFLVGLGLFAKNNDSLYSNILINSDRAGH